MNIKLVLSLTTLVFSTTSHADQLIERKNKVIQGIDKKIEHLSSLKSCISNASKKEELKICKQEHKSTMKALRETRGAERQKNKENKITMLEEKLKRLKEEKSKKNAL